MKTPISVIGNFRIISKQLFFFFSEVDFFQANLNYYDTATIIHIYVKPDDFPNSKYLFSFSNSPGHGPIFRGEGPSTNP